MLRTLAIVAQRATDGPIGISMDPSMETCHSPDMWHERLGSNASAAKRIFPEWKKKARSEVDREHTTETALANRIGTLRRAGDKTGWWQKRPKLRQLLADLAEVDEDVIFQRSPSNLVFREFPALPALAKDEAPCRLDPRGSTFDLVVAELQSQEPVRTWLKVPAGGGKSLTVELLRARWSSEVLAVSVRTLQELVAQRASAAGRPIVAEVEVPRGDSDRHALDALQRHAQAVILLAPFDCPDDRHLPGIPRSRGSTWRVIDGVPGDGWMERMLRWIDERLEASGRDTKLQMEDVRAWFHEHAERARMVRTPGDLLALCADFDQFGAGASLVERSERWLDMFGRGWLPGDAPRTWAARGALPAYRELVRADFQDTAIVHGHRPFERWTDLVSDRWNPGPAHDIPGHEMVVAYIEAAGLLRGGEHGAEPYPRWVGRGIVQRAIEELVGALPEDWGRLAADESRRVLVDDALDELSEPSSRALRRKILSASGQPTGATSLGYIGALEATLAATARRLTSGDSIVTERDSRELQQLLGEQLRYIVAVHAGSMRLPLTRRDLDEWYVTGWAISLATPAPAGWADDELCWVLPGWAPSLRLDDLPRHQTPSSTVQPWGATRAVQALVRLAPRIVDRLEPHVLPDDPPRIFLPALFMSASTWDLGTAHLRRLGGSWEEMFLASAVDSLPDHERSSLARRLWKLVGEAVDSKAVASILERIDHLKDSHPPLLRFVMDNLPPEVIRETAYRGGIVREDSGISPYSFQELPRQVRSAAIKGWFQAGQHRSLRFEARDLIGVLDDADLALVLDDLRSASLDVAWGFTALAWNVRPVLAFEEARVALTQRLPSVEAWFYTAPREYLGRLVDDLEQVTLRPAWGATWALRRLLEAGPAADRLLALARAGATGPVDEAR